MLSDIIKSMQSHISDRLTSPLMGSFIVAWALWNYRFIAVLFSDATILRTFYLIDNVIYPSTWIMIVRGGLLPLATALLYIFAFPFPSRFVYRFARLRQKELNAVRQQIEKETLLSTEESRALRTSMEERELSLKTIVDRKDSQISALTNKLSLLELNSSINTLPPVTEENSGTDITNSQIIAMRKIAENNGQIRESSLREQSKNKIEIDFDVGELLKRKLITRTRTGALGEHNIKFTQEGRAFVLENPY